MMEKYAERTDGYKEAKVGDSIDMRVGNTWKVGKVKMVR